MRCFNHVNTIFQPVKYKSGDISYNSLKDSTRFNLLVASMSVEPYGAAAEDL